MKGADGYGRDLHRSREDTIRCIVSSLIEDGNELIKELAASDAKPVQDARDDAENYNDPKWAPEPIDAPAGTFPFLSWRLRKE